MWVSSSVCVEGDRQGQEVNFDSFEFILSLLVQKVSGMQSWWGLSLCFVWGVNRPTGEEALQHICRHGDWWGRFGFFMSTVVQLHQFFQRICWKKRKTLSWPYDVTELLLLFLTWLLSRSSIFLSGAEPGSTFPRYASSIWRSFMSRNVWSRQENFNRGRGRPGRWRWRSDLRWWRCHGISVFEPNWSSALHHQLGQHSPAAPARDPEPACSVISPKKATHGPTPHLCRGGVSLQYIHNPLEAQRRLLSGKAKPVPAGKQRVHIRPGFELRSRRQCCHKVLLLWDLRWEGEGQSQNLVVLCSDSTEETLSPWRFAAHSKGCWRSPADGEQACSVALSPPVQVSVRTYLGLAVVVEAAVVQSSDQRHVQDWSFSGKPLEYFHLSSTLRMPVCCLATTTTRLSRSDPN